MVVATLAVLTLDFRTNLLDGLSGATEQVVGVFQTGVRTLVQPVESVMAGAVGIGRLRADNAKLRRENEQLRKQSETYGDIVRENARLRQLLELGGSLDLPTISARVIGVSLSGLERVAMIDKGSSSGIVRATAVLGPEGLVGRVFWTGARTANILLLIDSQSSIGVKIGRTGETGIVSGTGGRMLRLELVSRAALDRGDVKRGDVVLTSGYQGGIFPAGLPVGRIEDVQLAQRGTSYEITVRPFARLSRLDVVAVATATEAPGQTPAPAMQTGDGS